MCIRKNAILVYAIGAYAVAMVNLAYIMGFLAGLGVPKTINDGPTEPAWLAVLIDVALVSLFGLHHSITARMRFKDWWAHFVPPSLERATYLYMTAAVTGFLVWQWRPIDIVLWQVENTAGAMALRAAYLCVWAWMFAATFHFGHLGFFGIRQALDRVRDRSASQPRLSVRYLYALVRHPISLGWMIVPWLTPHMTAGQMVFATCTAIYVLAATPFEEADLVRELGDSYRTYRRQVPAFVPRKKLFQPGIQEDT